MSTIPKYYKKIQLINTPWEISSESPFDLLLIDKFNVTDVIKRRDYYSLLQQPV